MFLSSGISNILLPCRRTTMCVRLMGWGIVVLALFKKANTKIYKTQQQFYFLSFFVSSRLSVLQISMPLPSNSDFKYVFFKFELLGRGMFICTTKIQINMSLPSNSNLKCVFCKRSPKQVK